MLKLYTKQVKDAEGKLVKLEHFLFNGKPVTDKEIKEAYARGEVIWIDPQQ